MAEKFNSHLKWMCTIFLASLIPMLTACEGLNFTVKRAFGPLEVSVDTTGKILFTPKEGITVPTPLGDFEIGVVADPISFFQARGIQVKNTLTIRIDGQDKIYDLNGQDFDVSLESGYYEQIDIKKTDTNIFIEVRKRASAKQGCLPKSKFVGIMNDWHEKDRNNPSPAINELNILFDEAIAADQLIGEEWSSSPFIIDQGATGSVVFWTNTSGKTVKPITSSGVVLDLLLSGGYGIRAAWDTDVEIPRPGRSAWLCERLDPARDFPWWG